MITTYKDRVDAASYAELYALARGILMDLEAMRNAPGELLHSEIRNSFEVYLPEKA
jgi:hypothetical protein